MHMPRNRRVRRSERQDDGLRVLLKADKTVSVSLAIRAPSWARRVDRSSSRQATRRCIHHRTSPQPPHLVTPARRVTRMIRCRSVPMFRLPRREHRRWPSRSERTRFAKSSLSAACLRNHRSRRRPRQNGHAGSLGTGLPPVRHPHRLADVAKMFSHAASKSPGWRRHPRHGRVPGHLHRIIAGIPYHRHRAPENERPAWMSSKITKVTQVSLKSVCPFPHDRAEG